MVKTNKKLREMIFDVSPYEGFDAGEHPADLQGWGSDHHILSRVIERIQPSRILEIGSWKGRSAINMARIARSIGLDTEIVCVDTWLGSPEHWLKGGEGWYESLRIKNGYPQLYWTFLGNVVRENLQDLITPFPSTSEGACAIFKRLGVYFDFCYLDAAHEYEPVMRDLTSVWSVLSEPGVIVGDDYIGWEGVTRAADEFARDKGVELIGEPGKFLICKGTFVPDLKS